MKMPFLLTCLMAAAAGTVLTVHAQFANSVVQYNSGTGFAIEFGSGMGYTNAAASLGEPSRITPGQFGGPVDPFNPPFTRDQLVSIGAGGSLTLEFNLPILNRPENPFGLDFVVFGNAGFIITNGDFTGGGITDGSLFGAADGETRVSVSANNQDYFQLNPLFAPALDGYFPTDGAGDFSLPVDPELTGGDFAGLGLGGIRSLYAGSGGGTGFDIDWALDESGRPAGLDQIRFVRFDVLSGAAEIDGVSAVPEASPIFLWTAGAVLFWILRRVRRSSLARETA